MNKRIVIMLMVVPIALYSCKMIVSGEYGIKKPKIESLVSISAALKKYSSGYPAHLCIFRDSAALVDWFRNKNLPARSRFYNSAGYRLVIQDSLFCARVEANIAGQLKPSTVYRIDSMGSFGKLKRDILPVGEKADLDTSKYTFTCVVFWAIYMGKVNDASFAVAEAALASQPGMKGMVNILFVNMDIMDFWNTSPGMIRTTVDKR